MALIDEEFDGFFRLVVQAIQPYLADVVIIGGCANALYRYHPLASESLIAHPGTKDLDVACHLTLPRAHRPRLHELLKAAGLESVRYGDGNPPVVKYSVGGAAEGSDLEFLCPLQGSGHDRRGVVRDAVDIEDSGVTAQPLRYVELLLIQPSEVSLATVPGFDDMSSLPPVRVPNPISYVMQKVLARQEHGRSSYKQEKDCYYIYEVSVIFRDSVELVIRPISEILGRFPARWTSRFLKDASQLFSSPASEGPVSAVRVGREARRGIRSAEDIDEAMVQKAVTRLVEAVKTYSKDRK